MGIHGRDILDDAGIEPRLELEVVGFRVALVSALRHKLRVALGGVDHELALVECTAHGFLDIDVFALIQSEHHAGEVREVGCLDKDGLKLVAHLVEHLAEIGVDLGVGMCCGRFAAAFRIGIDVAHGHDVGQTRLVHLTEHLGAAVGHADPCDVYLAELGETLLFVLLLLGGEDVGGARCHASHHHARGGETRSLQEIAA